MHACMRNSRTYMLYVCMHTYRNKQTSLFYSMTAHCMHVSCICYIDITCMTHACMHMTTKQIPLLSSVTRLYACIHFRNNHTHTHTHIHVCMNQNIQKQTNTSLLFHHWAVCMYAFSYTYIHTYAHRHMLRNNPAPLSSLMTLYACTHTRIHTYIHTHAHKHTLRNNPAPLSSSITGL
jgi:hypothetical protein